MNDIIDSEEAEVEVGKENRKDSENNIACALENGHINQVPLLKSKRMIILSILFICIAIFSMISYNLVMSNQANLSFNSYVNQLRNGEIEKAYNGFVDISNRYPNKKAGLMAKQCLGKIDNYKQLTAGVQSLSNEVSTKQKFIDNDFKTISDYLAQANDKMSYAAKIPIRDIPNDTIWKNQEEKYYQYITNLPQDVKQNFSTQDINILVSAFSMYGVVYLDSVILMNEASNSQPDGVTISKTIKDFSDSVDLFNNDNYPYCKSVLSKILSDFNNQKDDLTKKQQDLAKVNHDLENIPLL